MSVVQSLVLFAIAASVLTITPGVDTALVLRASASRGAAVAAAAALGIGLGCLIWGAAAATGLTALLSTEPWAFTALKWAGAAYLFWLGLRLILSRGAPPAPAPAGQDDRDGRAHWFRRGLLTNLLNPKVGMFYVSFLPQFLPAHTPAGLFMMLLASIHVAMGLAWFALLIAATRPLSRALRRPAVARAIDRVAGCVLIGFGVRLALSRR